MFNTPTNITQGSKFSTLVYGPNQDRIKHSDSNGRVTKYVGGIYEEVTKGGITQKLHYVGDFAIFIQKGGITPTNSYEYLHRDHIGTIVAISNSAANTASDIQWQTNGAWGERRFEQWNGPLDSSLIPTSTARGFTDHEHMDAVGLIHMNGRVYDPELGRFLSADPYVQSPYNSQSYNRYAYVFNNPLNYTDPTGYQAEESDQPTEETITTGDRINNRCPNGAVCASEGAYNFLTSIMGGGVWEEMNGAYYNIADIHGMTAYALAAGSAYPNQLRAILGLPPSNLLGSFALSSPVSDPDVSSEYSANRTCKVCSSTHRGTDYRGKIGTTVMATADGKVVFSGNHRDYGKMVVIDHGTAKDGNGNIYTLYGHADSLSVKEGEKINAGDKIMELGQSGKTTGPHVHYEIIRSQNGPYSNGGFLRSDERFSPNDLSNLISF